MAMAALAVAVAAVISGPFWLADPTRFSPLHTADKLRQFSDLLPGAPAMILAGTVLATMAASYAWARRDEAGVLLAGAVGLAFPVAVGMALEAAHGRRDTDYPGYGLLALWLAVLGAGWVTGLRPLARTTRSARRSARSTMALSGWSATRTSVLTVTPRPGRGRRSWPRCPRRSARRA